jgi:hypothetical protein
VEVPGQRPIGRGPLTEVPGRRSLKKAWGKGPRAKSREGTHYGLQSESGEERCPLPSCSWHYIGNNNLHTTP